MDLTPQTLREVEFREKLRGYHPDDVDDFLEDVAVAVDDLLHRLRAAESAASDAAAAPAPPVAAVPEVAEEPAPAAPPPSVAAGPPRAAGDDATEEMLKRTLVLAQRTADLAVAEAQESARQILEEARAEAERVRGETEAKVNEMAAQAQARSEAAVAELEERRAGLEREVAALQSWAAQQRDRLRDALSDQMRALDVWLATSTPPKTVRSPFAARSAKPAPPSDGRPAPDIKLPDTAPGGQTTEAVVSLPEVGDAGTNGVYDAEADHRDEVGAGDASAGAGGRIFRRL